VAATWLPLVGMTAYVALTLGIGLRLLRLGWSRGSVPELAVGISFVTGGALGGGLQVLATTRELMPVVYGGATLAFSKLCVHVAVLAQGLFTWHVFRRDAAWARRFFLASVAIWAATSIGYALAGGITDPDYSGPWFWLEFGAQAALIGWSAFEPLHYARKMGRRLRFGLADPVVANRFFLWGTSLSLGLLAAGVGPVIHAVPHEDWSRPLIGLAAALGSASTACAWLTFFPPRAYVSWVQRRAARAVGACRSSPSP
jgi:hypothetical protein